MITTFRVQNYKALRDVTLQLTPMHLLIGPNDSGKTSILEALAALSRSVNCELPKAFVGTWEGDELVRNRAASAVVTLSVDVQATIPFYYEIGVSFLRRGREIFIQAESLNMARQVYDLKSDELPSNTSTLFRVALGDPRVGKRMEPRLNMSAARMAHDSLRDVQVVRWNPRLLALPCALDQAKGFRLDESGFGLARVLDLLLGGYREKYVALEDRLKCFFPAIKTLRILPTAGFLSQSSEGEYAPMFSRQDGKGIYVELEGSEGDVPASQLSDGILILLAYLAVIYAPQPPHLLLIEEPENGIHPERLKEIITILRELQKEHPETQVIMTSHSTYIVDLFEPEEVSLCRKNDQGEVQVKRLSDSDIVRDQLKVFSLGEIWPAEEDRIFKEVNGAAALPTETVP